MTQRNTVKKPIKSAAMSASQMAQMFGVTRKCIADWAKIGMPKKGFNAYDSAECFTWWQENINKEATSESGTSARDRYWLAKAESEEIKVAKLKGMLASIDDFERQEAHRAAGLRGSLRGLTSRLVSVLEMKTREEIRPILQKEIDMILEFFFRTRSYGEQEEEKPKKVAKKKPTKRKVKK